MLDPDEQFCPHCFIEGDVGEVSSPGLLSDTAMETLECFDFINREYDSEVMTISSFDKTFPASVLMVLVSIDVPNHLEVVEDDWAVLRVISIYVLHDANRPIIPGPNELLLHVRHDAIWLKLPSNYECNVGIPIEQGDHKQSVTI